MKLKNNIFTALLLAIGFILNQVIPGIFGGMKFDILLSFIFISLLINNSFKNAILTGSLGGLLSAMTTTFPGGQIPNVIDKLITSIVIFVVIKLLRRFNFNTMLVGFISGFGTLISGAIFLISALLITGLPMSFTVLLTTVVLPTILLNSIITSFIYQVVKHAMKVSGVNLGQL